MSESHRQRQILDVRRQILDVRRQLDDVRAGLHDRKGRVYVQTRITKLEKQLQRLTAGGDGLTDAQRAARDGWKAAWGGGPKMCAICDHAERAAIEAAMGKGESFRAIARQFGVSTTTLHRHKGGHMPVAVEEPPPAVAVTQPDPERPAPVARKAACSVCGGSAWWPRPHRRWLCATCYPEAGAV